MRWEKRWQMGEDKGPMFSHEHTSSNVVILFIVLLVVVVIAAALLAWHPWSVISSGHRAPTLTQPT